MRNYAINTDNNNMLVIRCTAGQLLETVACLDTSGVIHFTKILLPLQSQEHQNYNCT